LEHKQLINNQLVTRGDRDPAVALGAQRTRTETMLRPVRGAPRREPP